MDPSAGGDPEKSGHAANGLPVPASEPEPSSSAVSHSSINGEKQAIEAADGGNQADTDEVEPAPVDQKKELVKIIIILIAIALSVFLVALDMTIVATAIPRITDEFQSLDQVGWYGSAFFLTIAAFQSTWGKIYKYFPLKLSFLVAIFWFEVGSLICAVAQSSTTLIVGRAIAGAGGAGIASGAYTIIAFAAPPGKTAAFTGILGATYAVASVVGPVLGGVFTDELSWRWCFYINLPVGGASAALIIFMFKTPKAARPQEATLREKILQMDLVGTFLLMAAVVCAILVFQWGGVTRGWGDADVIGTLVGFVLIIGVFIIWELRMGERALLLPRIIKQKTIALMCAFQAVNSGAFLELLYYLPIYFQVVSGVSAAQSGIRNLPYILGISLLTIVSGVVITITGHYLPLLLTGGVLASIGCGLLFTLDINTGSSAWIGYQALAGIGFGLSIQIPIIVGQGIAPPADLSSITAMIIFFQSLAGAIFVSVGQALFANRLVQAVPAEAPGVEPLLVVGTGATELRVVFTDAADLAGVIRSYMEGLSDAYALAIALTCVATAIAALAFFIDRRVLDVKKGVPVGAA